MGRSSKLKDKLSNHTVIIEDDETLNKGIWPCSGILWIAAFYMGLFIIRPWEVIFPWMQMYHPERVYALFMIASVCLSKEKHFKMSWQTVTVLFFLFALVLSTIYSFDPAISSEFLKVYITIVIFYFIILFVVRTPYELTFIIISYVAIMCVYLGKSQWEFFLNGRHRYTMGVSRLVGIEDTFGGPNSLAMSIVVSLPFALFLWKNRLIITETWPLVWKNTFQKSLIIYSVLAVTSIILTNSRSGMVGLFMFIMILMLKGKGFSKKIKSLMVSILFLFLIWVLMPAENQGRLRTIWNPESGPANAQKSADGRLEGFYAGMIMFQQSPFVGVGLNNFVPFRVQNVDGVPLQAHNLPGQILGETGMFGCFTFILMVGTIFTNCRKISRLANNQSDVYLIFLSDLATACYASLLLLSLLSIFGHTAYRFNWLWLAAFSSLALMFAEKRSLAKGNKKCSLRN